jgi:hypothetical protein
MCISMAVVKRPLGSARKFSLNLDELSIAIKYGVDFKNQSGVKDYISANTIHRAWIDLRVERYNSEHCFCLIFSL